MEITVEQLISFLQLPGIGNAKVFTLANYINEQKIKLSNDAEMLELLKLCIAEKIIKGIPKEGYSISDLIKATNTAKRIVNESNRQGIKVVSYYDSTYPQNLRKIININNNNCSPLILYIKGNIDTLSNPKGIAIIGTREPTTEGKQAGIYFSELFSEKGYNIISGLALGCDTFAHQGALNKKGITTAFLAHGLDQKIYPKDNTKLAEQIIDSGGMLISEYPIGTQLMANRLVERDRLQSGLANATLVIQTGIKGGTMHAVNATISNKKPLFAIQFKGETLMQDKVQGNIQLINNGKANVLNSGNVNDAFEIIEKYITANAQHKIIKNKQSQLSLFD
jgi:DNA processing protein